MPPMPDLPQLPALDPELLALEDTQARLEARYGHEAVCRCCRSAEHARVQGIRAAYVAAAAAAMRRPCPTCRAAPDAVCSPRARRVAAGSDHLIEHWHWTRGVVTYEAPCPACLAEPGERCVGPHGSFVDSIHVDRGIAA